MRLERTPSGEKKTAQNNTHNPYISSNIDKSTHTQKVKRDGEREKKRKANEISLALFLLLPHFIVS